ncbi:MAG TPA: hypothetical protein VMB24_01240 [Dehalococcoidales bacterium]|nr:hypothetical protein [Dehalococcoidales bacterium]
MKRFLFLLMLIIAVLVVTVGIIESQSWHGDPPGAHIAIAAFFIILIAVHLIMQRKAVWRYITWSGKLPADPRQMRLQIMRRITFYLLIVFGLLTIVSGALSADVPGCSVFHAVMLSIFLLFVLRHVLANRKAVRRFFSGGEKGPAVAIPDVEDSAS